MELKENAIGLEVQRENQELRDAVVKMKQERSECELVIKRCLDGEETLQRKCHELSVIIQRKEEALSQSRQSLLSKSQALEDSQKKRMELDDVIATLMKYPDDSHGYEDGEKEITAMMDIQVCCFFRFCCLRGR